MNKAHVSLNQLFFSGQASRNLFSAPHFYSLYQVFIKVAIQGKNDYSLFLHYQGHVESKLRKFTKLLEDSCNKYMNMMVMQLWPYPETFLNPAKQKFKVQYFYGLKAYHKGTIDLVPLVA